MEPISEKDLKNLYFQYIVKNKTTICYDRAFPIYPEEGTACCLGWLCHSMWLLHLNSAVKIQPFLFGFSLGGIQG